MHTIDSGATKAQFFVGREPLVVDVYGVNTDKQFVASLQHNIWERGVMDTLITDRAQVQIGETVKNIMHHLFIKNWQSEPHLQQPSPVEQRHQNVKHNTQHLMNQ